MGTLTYIDTTFDDEAQVQRIFAVTKLDISTRAALNRVASRAALMTGVGQRTLVAAAYDELGISLVWREGPVAIPPEEKWPEAQQITFRSVEIERVSEFGDITDIPRSALPSGKVFDLIINKIDAFRPDEHMHIWEIPYSVGGRGG